MTSETQTMTAEALYQLQLITAAKIDPTGRRVVYTLQRVDQASEKKYTNLWLIDLDDPAAKPQQFTYGDQSDASPVWSPDGRTIAFLSNRKDEKQSQIYLIGVNGGEARLLTELDGQIGSLAWSPDGQKLLFVFRKKDEAELAREKDEQKKKLGVVERHITRVFNRNDGGSFAPEEKWHIWTVDVASGDATQITSGAYDEYEPCWTPDGASILYQTTTGDNWDLELDQDEYFLIPAGGGEPRQILTHKGGKHGVAISPDGKSIAYRGQRLSPGKWYQNEVIFVASLDENSAGARQLTTASDVDMGSSTLGDSGTPGQSAVTWSPDSETIFSTGTRHGGNPLYAIDASNGEMGEVYIDGTLANGLVDFDRAHTKLIYLQSTLTDPMQLYVHDIASGQTRQLTDLNPQLRELNLGQTEEVWVEGPDDNKIHGWILTPPDFDASQQYPTLLYIHGGPQTQYGRAFMHEFYFLAAQGYVIGYSNPRGGQGYGEGHAGAIHGQWGTVDYDDLMAFTDYLADLPYVDEERMGVVGGSYGGYMTGMIVGMNDRFQAACAQRMVSNFISFHGTSDFNWAVKYLVGLEGEPWNNLEDYWRMSPMSLVGNVKTPTLVIHSENDLRCAQEQGEQYFVALRRHGVDSELVLFPGESHGLSRGGRTDRRISRLNHVLRWFDKYLKD